MTVDSVCSLLANVEGISAQRLSQYKGLLREHNITGSVLLTCDLQELKLVLQMVFGDWELFRATIEVLRVQENSVQVGGSLLSPKENFGGTLQAGNELVLSVSQELAQTAAGRQNLMPIMEGKEDVKGGNELETSNEEILPGSRSHSCSVVVTSHIDDNTGIVGEVLQEADFLKSALEAAGLSDAIDNDYDDDFTDGEVSVASVPQASMQLNNDDKVKLRTKGSRIKAFNPFQSAHSDSSDSDGEHSGHTKADMRSKVSADDRIRLASLDYQKKPKSNKRSSKLSETRADGGLQLLLSSVRDSDASRSVPVSSPPSPLQQDDHKTNRFSFPSFRHHVDSSGTSSRAPSRPVSRAPSYKRLNSEQHTVVIDESAAANETKQKKSVLPVDTVVQFDGENIQVRNLSSVSQSM